MTQLKNLGFFIVKKVFIKKQISYIYLHYIHNLYFKFIYIIIKTVKECTT